MTAGETTVCAARNEEFETELSELLQLFEDNFDAAKTTLVEGHCVKHGKAFYCLNS